MPRQSSCNDKGLFGDFLLLQLFFLQEGIFMNVVTREEKKFLINIDEFRNKSYYLDSLKIGRGQNLKILLFPATLQE